MDPTDIVLVPFDIHKLTVFVGIVWCLRAVLGQGGEIILLLLLLKEGGGGVTVKHNQSSRTHISSFLLQQTLHFLQATVATWMIAILCGVPPTTQHIKHTLLACFYIVTLAFFPITNTNTRTADVIMDSTTTNKQYQQQLQQQLPWWQARLILPPLTQLLQVQLQASSSQQQQEEKVNNHNAAFFMSFLTTCQTHGTLFGLVPCSILRLYDWGSQIQRWPLPLILGSTYGFVAGTVLSIVYYMIYYLYYCHNSNKGYH